MPSTVFDSFYFKDRFGSPAMRAIWDDRATLQRWLDVEAALAEVEAELGLIPKTAAREIARNARIEKLDLRAMKRGFDRTWNPVVPLVDALKSRLSPRAAGYLHWGATSKNIFDTGLVLQVRDSYRVIEENVAAVNALLAGLAEHPPGHRHGRPHPRPARPPGDLRLQGGGLARRDAAGGGAAEGGAASGSWSASSAGRWGRWRPWVATAFGCRRAS